MRTILPSFEGAWENGQNWNEHFTGFEKTSTDVNEEEMSLNLENGQEKSLHFDIS